VEDRIGSPEAAGEGPCAGREIERLLESKFGGAQEGSPVHLAERCEVRSSIQGAGLGAGKVAGEGSLVARGGGFRCRDLGGALGSSPMRGARKYDGNAGAYGRTPRQ
jgi:hypothetical protein